MMDVIDLVDEYETHLPLLGSKNSSDMVDFNFKKADPSKISRYVDTRLDEVFPVKKARLTVLSGKENVKVVLDPYKQNMREEKPAEQHNYSKDLSFLSIPAAKNQHPSSESCSAMSAGASKDDVVKAKAHLQSLGKCSQSTFRSVTEISESCARSSRSEVTDMDKALKRLVAHDFVNSMLNDSSETNGNSTSAFLGKFCSECHIPGKRVPLDLTLKTKIRVSSSCSVNWVHRSVICASNNGILQQTPLDACPEGNGVLGNAPPTSRALGCHTLHSWVYPQSVLPASVISLLASPAVEEAEVDFLRRRNRMWEDSFRSLYYMLRKNLCNVFFVCTSKFVVMFTSNDASKKTKPLCNAYVSRSTMSMRSLLREHDVSFSMPLCQSKEEHLATEDLVELSEIEKQNLGQTRRLRSLSDADSSFQSLLAFHGNRNVHGLFDFLLNYRSIMTYLSSADVPALYSPVAFPNSSVSSPQMRCVEMKAGENASLPKNEMPSTFFYSTIEIKDKYIPPWIVCRLCALLGSNGKSFEACFTTEHTSVGLNVAVMDDCKRLDSSHPGETSSPRLGHTYGIEDAVLAREMCSGFLKGLKFSSDSYTASLSPP